MTLGATSPVTRRIWRISVNCDKKQSNSIA
jgi:hypothetical protein